MEAFIEGFEILKLRTEKLKQSFVKFELVRNTNERKEMLEQIAKDIERANADIKSLQYEVLKAPKSRELELIEQLNKQRAIVNELEENLNEKKKKFKFEIKLVDEHKHLENLEAVDPENVDIDIIEKVGINLPNTEAIEKIKKQVLKSQNSARNKAGQQESLRSVIISPEKDKNEVDLEKKILKPMVIDLQLQKLDSCGKRTCDFFAHFWNHYCKDKLSCPLMILMLCSLAFVIVGYVLPDKKNVKVL